jgi:hypothetical protein
MGVTNVELGQDVAVDIRGETNGDIVVEYCDMTSLRLSFNLNDVTFYTPLTSFRFHFPLLYMGALLGPFYTK